VTCSRILGAKVVLDGKGIATAALRGLCPSCGTPGLFAGPIAFSDKCCACGLDYSQFNVGDGPAAFLIMIVGAIITVLAIVVELRFGPPFWVHILLWVPLTALLVVGLLRIAKALLLILEYQNRAREGRLSE
jgi:uncharacterized protein (DUF983 family)